MLYYDRIDVSERIDIKKSIKTNASKQCDMYHYWYFLDKWFFVSTVYLQQMS